MRKIECLDLSCDLKIPFILLREADKAKDIILGYDSVITNFVAARGYLPFSSIYKGVYTLLRLLREYAKELGFSIIYVLPELSQKKMPPLWKIFSKHVDIVMCFSVVDEFLVIYQKSHSLENLASMRIPTSKIVKCYEDA
ncbi:MAG TPA: hypothetical protein ENG54_03435 [Thermofilum sp.]|nr:hypothetical protein [Thermofilum sp.]